MCGHRGFYAAIGIFWGFRCENDECGYKDGNTEQWMRLYGPDARPTLDGEQIGYNGEDDEA